MQIKEVLEQDGGLPEPVRIQLDGVVHILNPENLARRYAWIEQRQNGAHTLQSVPEHVSDFLSDLLYSRFPTTLLIPPQSAMELKEILPQSGTSHVEEKVMKDPEMPITFPLTPVH